MDNPNIVTAAELPGDSEPDTKQADILRIYHGAPYEHISTVSSSSQEASKSNKRGYGRSQSTRPTSQSSYHFNIIHQRNPDSDIEAHYGSSDNARLESSSESSSNSDRSQVDLPRLATQDQIRNIGHHLLNPMPHSMPTGLQPATAHEARVVSNRENRARGKYNMSQRFNFL